MVTVSVVIPVYGASYVREALESALAQTWAPTEIIVVDSSPETTRPRIEGYLDRITYFYEPPRGVSAARNAGIRAAKGDLVAFLDADDLWMPEKLAVQVPALSRRGEADFSFSTVWNLTDQEDPGIPRDPFYPPPLRDWLGAHPAVGGVASGWVYDLLLATNCVATSSVAVRRAVLETIGLFDESFSNGEDYDLWLRLAKRYPAAFVCNPIARYRVHDAGLSGAWTSRPELFYRNNIRVLEKHQAMFPSVAVRDALTRSYAGYSSFLLKSNRRAEARRFALRSFRLRPTLAATRTYLEAVLPGDSAPRFAERHNDV